MKKVIIKGRHSRLLIVAERRTPCKAALPICRTLIESSHAPLKQYGAAQVQIIRCPSWNITAMFQQAQKKQKKKQKNVDTAHKVQEKMNRLF